MNGMDVLPAHGLPRLRPMSLSDILDAVFRIYRSHFLTLLGIVALLQVPMVALQLVVTLLLGQRVATDIPRLVEMLSRFNPREDTFSGLPLGGIVAFFVASFALSLLQGLVVQQCIQGALTSAVSQRYLGRSVTIQAAYASTWRHIGALLGAAVLLGLLGLLVFGVAFGLLTGVVVLLSSLIPQGNGSAAAVVGVLLVFVLIALFALLTLGLAALLVRFIFFTQAVVVEQQGPLAALRRSWRLVRGSYWRVLGIVLVVWLLATVLIGLPSGVGGAVIGLFLPDPIKDFALRQTLTTLITYIGQIVILPIQLISYTLLYYDLRVRKEGYDLELLAGQQQ